MKTNTLKTLSFDYDLETGFAVVTLDDAEKSTVQCCLIMRHDRDGYTKKIDRDDSGMLEGVCAEVNEKAFDLHGVNKCKRILFSSARKNGILPV